MLVYESIIANTGFCEKKNSIILCRTKARDFTKLIAMDNKPLIEFEKPFKLITQVLLLEFIKISYFIAIIYLLSSNYILRYNLALLITVCNFICRFFCCKRTLILNYE